MATVDYLADALTSIGDQCEAVQERGNAFFGHEGDFWVRLGTFWESRDFDANGEVRLDLIVDQQLVIRHSSEVAVELTKLLRNLADAIEKGGDA